MLSLFLLYEKANQLHKLFLTLDRGTGVLFIHVGGTRSCQAVVLLRNLWLTLLQTHGL